MQKDNYFSAIKGMAIIAVLFIHIPFQYTFELKNIILRQPFTFAVALFFFISGYFIKKTTLDTKGIKRILIPYLIWNLSFFLFSTIKGSVPVNGKRIVDVILFGGGFFPLYFLSVMIQLKLLTPFIIKFHNSYKWSKYLLFSTTPIFLIILYLLQYNTGKQPWIYVQIFPAWFFFYYLGIYIQAKKIVFPNINLIFLLVLSIAVMFMECIYIYDVWKIPFFAASQLKFSTFFFTFIIILILINNYQSSYPRNLLSKIGEYSFGIYLLHIPIKILVDKVIGFLIFDPSSMNPILPILTVIIVLFFSFLLIKVASKILSNKTLQILGLQ